MACPCRRSAGREIGRWMACEACLWIRFRECRAQQEIDNSAFAGPGPADDGNVNGRRGLPFEERADGIAHEGSRETKLPRLAAQCGLAATVVFKPAEIAGEKTDELAMIGGVHQPAPGLATFYRRNQDWKAIGPGWAGGRSGRKAATGKDAGRSMSKSAITRAVAGESWIPARTCPVATNALRQSAIRPMTGNPSRDPGRRPDQAFSTGC